MPSRRRYTRKRYTRRKRNYTSVPRLARQVKAIANRIESKYLDYQDVVEQAELPSATVTGYNFSVCSQGTANEERVGNEVKWKKLQIRGWLANNQGTPADCIVRMIILIWRDNDNADTQLQNVLQNPTSINSLYHMQHAKSKRFKILLDNTFTMQPDTDADTQKFLPIKIRLPVRCKTIFNSNYGDYRDVERNMIRMYLLATSATANNPIMTFDWRMGYYDA